MVLQSIYLYWLSMSPNYWFQLSAASPAIYKRSRQDHITISMLLHEGTLTIFYNALRHSRYFYYVY